MGRVLEMIVLAAFFLIACDTPGPAVTNSRPSSISGDVGSDILSGGADQRSKPASGSFTVLTYNIAGLPQGISGSNPETNIPQISPLLNGYDLVLLQEDFWYHKLAISAVKHPHQSSPWREILKGDDIGDGLNRLSRDDFADHQRIKWPGCHGKLECAFDCLATKGFSVARHTLPSGATVDVYNLHMEAGSCAEDIKIRAVSVDLLIKTIKDRSTGIAVIMGGDFNLHVDRPVDKMQFQKLLDSTGLRDGCWSVGCNREQIDRVLIRSSNSVSLTVTAWSVPAEFIDAENKPLSDHVPVTVSIEWKTP